MPKLTVAGQQIDPKEEKYASLQERFDLRVEPRTAVRVGVSRGDNATVELADLHDDDLVELTYSNGLHQWTTVDKLRQRYAEAQTAERGNGKATAEDEVLIDAFLTEGAERGTADVVLETLELLGFSPSEEIAKVGAKALIAHFENKLTPGPGLYHITAQGELGEKITNELSSNDRPYLLLIHGTFSSTLGTFYSLFNSREWGQLWDYYAGQIVGFNHRSLSQSPVSNALDLIDQLSQGAKLHIVSHSRGGLVGELLAMDTFDESYIDEFNKHEYKTDIDGLRSLSKKLQEKKIDVRRFVRVACPARGTLLASERFDEYLSAILNLIGYIPILKESQIYDFAKATILTLVKMRASPKDIPGLEAQRPDSPLVRMLNRPGHKSSSDLAVVAGDLEVGGNFWSMLKTWASDLFYWEDHDLVVHTKSMYGGLERPQNAVYFLRRAHDMNHFNYFVNDDSRSQVYRWLTQKPGASPEDFHALSLVREEVRSAVRGKAAADAPIVILIPGVFASQLRVADTVWLDRERLANGELAKLAINQLGIKPAGIVSECFESLIDALSEQFEVHVHDYDWRNSLKDEVKLLAARVEEALQKNRKLYLLAHSSGGLLARALLAYQKPIWENFCKRGGRLLMLGTPNQGSYALLELLTGEAELIRMLDLLDDKLDLAAICKQFRSYPGILELLPHSRSDWREAFLATLDESEKQVIAKLLDAAAAVTKEIASAVDPLYMYSVEGKADSTVGGIAVKKIGKQGVLSFLDSPMGDGFVTTELSRLAGVSTWTMDAVHGELVNQPDHFAALIELLLNGNTWQLPGAKEIEKQNGSPKVKRQRFVLYPTMQELVAAALYTSRPKPLAISSEPSVRLRISVLHAGLEHASHPLAIGHYDGDTIVGAEALLDSKLGYRLSQRRYMDLYPGSAGTVEIILNPLGEHQGQAKGALVIGLGEVGEVTPDIVSNGISEAALRLALARLENAVFQSTADDQSKPKKPLSAAFSVLLIGTRGGKVLSIESSVAAIVTGAIAANRMLRERKLLNQVVIDAVQFVEIHSEYAIRAAHAVANIKQFLRLPLTANESIEPARFLNEGEGGYTGQPLHDYDVGWWQPLQIKAVEDSSDNCKAGALQFLRLTDRARAELTVQSTQQALVQSLVQKSIQEASISLELPATLYDLLLPNELKELSLASGNLLLVLDSKTAQFPWEMMAERNLGAVRPGGEQLEPLSVRMGLIRQLERNRFRNNVQPTHSRHVLVIGDPLLDDPHYPPLPGARAEAEAVVQLLSNPKHGFDVTALIQRDPIAIINALFARDYRIIHIAGHGIYRPECPTQSGIVLGKNIYLTAAEIGQLRIVPEMVFLNCCHGGRIDLADGTPTHQPAWNQLAASVSEKLIEIGVRAVVAAGWAVNDRAARKFAEALYGRMLGDKTEQFGEAVRAARDDIYRSDRRTNTWGAYQCYGDPGFMLRMAASSTLAKEREYVAVEEVKRQLKNYQARARQTNATNSRTRNEIKNEIVKLENRVRTDMPSNWYDGDLLCMFADTYSELFDFRAAIVRYREAIKASGAKERVPLQAIEQLANLAARYAWILHIKENASSISSFQGVASTQETTNAEKDWSPKSLLDEAKQHLEWLLKLQPSAHRLSLFASYHKRRAIVLDGKTKKSKDARSNALQECASTYRQAFSMSKGSDIVYAGLNWITCQVLAGIDLADAELYSDLEGAFEKCQNDDTTSTQTDFWSRIKAGDFELANLLFKKYEATSEEQSESIQKIRQRYQSAFALGGTLREHSTVLENLEFIVAMLRWRGKVELAEKLQTMMEKLRPRQED